MPSYSLQFDERIAHHKRALIVDDFNTRARDKGMRVRHDFIDDLDKLGQPVTADRLSFVLSAAAGRFCYGIRWIIGSNDFYIEPKM